MRAAGVGHGGKILLSMAGALDEEASASGGGGVGGEGGDGRRRPVKLCFSWQGGWRGGQVRAVGDWSL